MEETELFDTIIKGPGPYGFRLYGGEGDPLIVAKLRARSKAHDAGLREGDVVLGINGRTCQSMSHGIAMALLESTEDALHLHLYRGSTAKDALLAAYQSLGSQLRPVSPGTVPPNRSIFTIQPTPEAQPPSAASQPPEVQPPVQPAAAEPAAAPVTSFSRQQEVTSLGEDVTQTITTQTEKKDLGGVTLTKVTRQVVLETGAGGSTWPPPSSSQTPAKRDDDVVVQRAAIFHVPKIKAQPLLWQPESSGTASAAAAERGRGADRFLVNRPITVDVSPFDGAGGKENADPLGDEPPRFKVQKTTAKRWVWQPSSVPSLPVREVSPALAFHVLEAAAPTQRAASPQDSHPVIRRDESGRGGGGGGGGGGGEGGGSSDHLSLSPDLIRVLTTEGPEEDWATFKRKKKIFADSAFYDDPEHKYPTIEEQIKMARKVALSLSAPDNVTARGQRMFMKRKEKSEHWTSDDLSFEGLATLQTRPSGLRLQRTSTEAPELYYNTAPWKTSAAKKRVEKGSIDPRVKDFEGYPEEAQESFVKNRSLFERGFGHESFHPAHYDRSGSRVHAPGGSGPPHPFHGLANDLREMRGKGAQLFAKRRAKLAEEEEAEEAEWNGWRSEGEAGLVRERSEERPGFDYPDPSDHLSRWEATAGRQVPKEPWRQKTKGKQPWRGVAAEDLLSTRSASEQKTSDGSRPSFLGKPSSGVYRPVRFHVRSEIHHGPSEIYHGPSEIYHGPSEIYHGPGVSEF